MKSALLRAARLLVLAPCVASAQRAVPHEPLLQGAPPIAARPACAPLVTSPTPTAEQRRQARDLVQRGQQSAILGDRIAARDQLRQAVALDPSNADFAYQLARAEESAGDDAGAARAYCRSISLAPDAPDAADSRTRLAQLTLVTRQADSAQAASVFRRAVVLYQRGQLDSAHNAFSAALARAPDWPAALYDRAVVRSALGQRDGATADFQQYLRVEPSAPNRAAVVTRIAELRDAPLSPSRALVLGLVIPGAGQFYAGRPVRGALSLVGAGLALACGMSQRASIQSVQQTATDPFGNPYSYTTSRRVTERPCRTPGFTAAGVIALVSAIDAYRFVQR